MPDDVYDESEEVAKPLTHFSPGRKQPPTMIVVHFTATYSAEDAHVVPTDKDAIGMRRDPWQIKRN